MVGACRLMLFADVFQAIGRSLELSLAFFLPIPKILLFLEERAMIRGERGHLRFAREKRAVLFVDPAAVNDAFGGKEIAVQGGEGESRGLLLEFLRLLEIRDERNVA